MDYRIQPILLIATAWVVYSISVASPAAQTARDRFAVSDRHDGILEFISSNGSIAASIQIEIADTPAARARGLMGRRELDDTAGMLFVYDDSGYRVFWMRNTPISLDIMFVSARGYIMNIAKNTRPMSDTQYRSGGLAQFVVETAAGFSDRFGIDAGTRIRWRRYK